MWQYYKACLIKSDEIKVIYPSGCKMMEHCYYDNKDMQRVEKLLTENKWRVMRIWDYSQCYGFVWGDSPLKPEKEYDEYYNPNDLLRMDINKTYYLINYTRKEYINMTKQRMNEDIEDGYGFIVHPLPLLCRVDSEDAWGDYRSEVNKDLLWLWCSDEIGIEIYDWNRDEEFKYYEYEDKTDIYFFKE